jgi:hypothetical protein
MLDARHRRYPTIPLALALLFLCGCIGFTRLAPSAENWRKGVRTIGLLPAIRVDEVHPGGIEERNDEWTASAARTVMTVLQEGLRKRGLVTRIVSWKGDPELDEVRLLYAEVADAVFQYTFDPYPFPTKEGVFDYGVGPVGQILDRAGVDVLVVAAGKHQIGVDGASVYLGTGSATFLSLGLLDRDGRLLWFDFWGERGLDLRKEEDARRMVEQMLANMPGVRS